MKKITAFIFICLSTFLPAQTSLDFDGINDYVLGTNNASLQLTRGTIEAQIKTSGAGNSYRAIVVKPYNYGIFLNNNVLIAFEWISGRVISTGVNLADGLWHHVAFSFDDQVVNGSKLYIDGLPVLTFTYKIANFNYSIAVGNQSVPASQYFNGNIDQVRVWNTVRTDAEIAANYNKCLVGKEAGMVMFWNFEEGAGTTVTDLSGNNNGGVLTNMDVANDWVQGYNCSNLIAHYPFDGNANDASGYNRHGTVFGATLTQDKEGNLDSAYYFDGTNQYIDLGDWENGGAMTFSFWARWDAFKTYSRIVDLSNGTRNNDVNIFNWSTSNEISFYVHNTDIGNYIYIKTPAITVGQWDFYATTVDKNGHMKIYKNGILITENPNGNPVKFMTRIYQYIGKSIYGSDGYFKGAIDDLRIYQKALSETEIISLLNNTLSMEEVKNKMKDFDVIRNQIIFRNSEKLSEVRNVFVYSIAGQIVFESKNIQSQTDLSFLKNGIYVLKVVYNNESDTVQKFVIY
jgi:hypothetical protein